MTTAYQIFQLPKGVPLNSGTIMPGGKASFFLTTTTTPTPVYTDADLTVAHTQPVVADAAGVLPTIYLDPSIIYKVTLTTSAGALYYSIDPVNDQILSQAVIGEHLYPQTAAELSAGVTPTNFAYPPGHAFRYDITGDGTDEHVQIQAALEVAGVDGGNLIFPVPPTGYNLGIYGVTVPENVLIVGDTSEQVIFDYAGEAFLDTTGDTDGSTGTITGMTTTTRLDVGMYVYVLAGFPTTGPYKITALTTTSVTLSTNSTSVQTNINVYTAGAAFTFIRGGNGLENVYVRTSHLAGNGLQFGNNSRRPLLRRVTAESFASPTASRTGTGLSLFTDSSATTFSGNMMLEQVYLLGYKYGINFNCYEVPTKTWTSLVGTQVFLIGGAGITGSRGIIMNATSNGVGSSIFGGTIELFEAPIEVANGGFGISYYGDIEGNTSDAPILGLSYNGEIVQHPNGTAYRSGSNSTVNRWYGERNLSGLWERESYNHQKWLIYDDAASARFFDFSRGASAINGGSPTLKWRFATGDGGADNAANRNYLKNMAGQLFTGDNNTPEGVVTAPVGSIYQRLNGGAVTSVYFKETGTGNTGWVAK